MKVILSRKGFDSANGGILSPIFEDGTILSFPIPSKECEKDHIRYDELTCNGISVDKLLSDLGYKGVACCHLDPDLDIGRRKKKIPEWKPVFGQINQSASYLINNSICEGDLFLFFGNFMHVKKEADGTFKYAHGTGSSNDTYYGRPIQAIWGYLQIEDIISNSEQ